ncbi:hypothetical protein ACFLZX_01660 [Nanoarchaeota archaeon]
MYKKAQIPTILEAIGLIIAALVVIAIGLFISHVINILSTSDERSLLYAENNYDELIGIVDNLKSRDQFLIPIQLSLYEGDSYAIFGFSKGVSTYSCEYTRYDMHKFKDLKKPAKCYEDSCICLCSFDLVAETTHKSYKNMDCPRCKRYDNKLFTSSQDKCKMGFVIPNKNPITVSISKVGNVITFEPTPEPPTSHVPDLWSDIIVPGFKGLLD